MNRTSRLLAIALGLALAAGAVRAQAPATFQAGPCTVAPRIDGIESPGEWDTAKRYDIDLRMAAKGGEARPTRHAQLLLMSSAANLYVALRVPDTTRDMSLSPLVADVAILAFCRGADVAAGDDRRVVAPGLFADKHFVAPGKDEDDAHRDGNGAMRWQLTPTAADYFVEWQVPLADGDANDIAGKPGERLRFNLVYTDHFTPDLTGTEIGGLYGVDTDHAAAWGAVALARDVAVEAPAPAPEWLARLFPDTGAPDRLSHRLRRLDATEIDAGGRLGGSVIVELSYPNLAGRDELGQARIFLPPSVRDDPTRRVPLVHVAGYEMDEAGAAGLMAKGYAVCTPHANPLNPLGRGVNLDRAILHAVRGLPCVDPLRVSIQGGSAGGWMTLMLEAEAFPLVWAMPDVPPIHWGYNAAYIGEQKTLAATPAPGTDKPWMPVLLAVGPIADQSRALYGMPFDSPTYVAASPLGNLETITAPTLTVFSTADMLVPINQVGAELVLPYDHKLFPSGFSNAMTPRFPGVNGKRTLLAALPRSQYEVLRVPPAANPSRLRPATGVQGPAKPVVLPFSKEKIWSIAVIDEGPIEPGDDHFKYAWAIDHEPFRRWAEARGVTAEQLTPRKLERLMKRLRGEPWRPMRVRPGDKGPDVAANQLDYPEAERADVLLGLAAFAADDARALRLGQLYARLPSRLKALGPHLGDGTPGGIRAALVSAQAGR